MGRQRNGLPPARSSYEKNILAVGLVRVKGFGVSELVHVFVFS